MLNLPPSHNHNTSFSSHLVIRSKFSVAQLASASDCCLAIRRFVVYRSLPGPVPILLLVQLSHLRRDPVLNQLANETSILGVQMRRKF
jgi:hypothetical protein